MDDLSIGITIVVLLSAVLAWLGLWLGQRLRRSTALVVLAVDVAFMAVFASCWQDRLWLARLLPLSALPVVGNWLPLAAGLLVGLAWRLIPGGAVRKSLSLVPLMGLGVWALYVPLLQRPPYCGNAWIGGIAIQTSPTTCSPAAAATFLRGYGISATENEMADLCLTREKGTTLHGLYRGLVLKTRRTEWCVRIVGGEVERLRPMRGPVIVPLLPTRGSAGRGDGFLPGVGHTVVLLGFHGQRLEIGDPSAGREFWRIDEMQRLWTGQGMILVRR